MEDLSTKPTAFPIKSIRKAKPSKRVISQTVVYREKETPTKSKRKPLQEQEKDGKQNDDSLVTSPTVAVDDEEASEEELMESGEGTGDKEDMTEESPGNEPVISENSIRDDVIAESCPEEGEMNENDKKTEKKIEQEEQQIVEGNEKTVVPKSKLMRIYFLWQRPGLGLAFVFSSLLIFSYQACPVKTVIALSPSWCVLCALELDLNA